MKTLTKTFIVFFFSILSFSQNDNNYERYGELFEKSEIINYELERDNFLNSSSKVKIEGEILSSCPMKGCWMRISCLLYTSPSPRDISRSRMPSSA